MQISRGIIGNDSSERWKMETRFTNPSILRVRIYIYIFMETRGRWNKRSKKRAKIGWLRRDVEKRLFRRGILVEGRRGKSLLFDLSTQEATTRRKKCLFPRVLDCNRHRGRNALFLRRSLYSSKRVVGRVEGGRRGIISENSFWPVPDEKNEQIQPLFLRVHLGCL